MNPTVYNISSCVNQPLIKSPTENQCPYRRLHLHGPGLPDLVLARVQIESLVLQNLPLAHDVPHVSVEEVLQRRDDGLVAASDVSALNFAQRVFGLTHADQCGTWKMEIAFFIIKFNF